MNFIELLKSAQSGDESAVIELLTLYDPMLIKSAVVNSMFDEDLYQELRIVLLHCIRVFPI